MNHEENRLNEILDRASEEAERWPEWMHSDEHRREMQRLERERAEAGKSDIRKPDPSRP